MSDQWKEDGNCDKCRRKKYCGTRCTANKNYFRQWAAHNIGKVMEKEGLTFMEHLRRS